MNQHDLQLLRHAALELQEDSNDLVRVAGVVQRIKNWWKAKFNEDYRARQEKVEDAYDNMKGPLSDLIKQLQELDKAFKSQNPDVVAQLVGQVPGTIARVTQDMGSLSKEMRAADAMIPVTYVDDKGQEVASGTLDWTSKGYRQNKDLVQKLWEQLPEEFREIPVGQRVNRPITDFSWFSRYDPSNISVSPKVYAQTQEQLKQGLRRGQIPEEEIDSIIEYGFDDFMENLKTAILNDAVLVQVNFPGVSADIKRRPTNQMMVDVKPGFVAIPVSGIEVPLHIGFVRLNDIGASLRPRPELSMVMVRTVTIDPRSSTQIKQVWEGQETEVEPVEPVIEEPEDVTEFAQPEEETIASDGPITKLVKRALIRQKCPLTCAVVKISGQTLHHKARFAKVLASALRQEIDAECSVRHQNDEIEVQVKVYGSKFISIPVIYGISQYVADQFLDATKVGVDVEVESGLSTFGLMESDFLDESFRKVALDYWSTYEH